MPVFVEVPKSSLKGGDRKEFVLIEKARLKGIKSREKRMIGLIEELQTSIKGTHDTAEKTLGVVRTWNNASVTIPRIDVAAHQSPTRNSSHSSAGESDSNPFSSQTSERSSSSGQCNNDQGSSTTRRQEEKPLEQCDSSKSVHLRPRKRNRRTSQFSSPTKDHFDQPDDTVLDLNAAGPSNKRRRAAPPPPVRYSDMYDKDDHLYWPNEQNVKPTKKPQKSLQKRGRDDTKSTKTSSYRPSLPTSISDNKTPATHSSKKAVAVMTDEPDAQNEVEPKAERIRNLRRYGPNEVPRIKVENVCGGVLLSWQFVPINGMRFNKRLCNKKLNSLIAGIATKGTTLHQLCGDPSNISRRFMDVYNLLVSFIVTEEIGTANGGKKVYLSGAYNLDFDDRSLAEYINDTPEPLRSALKFAGELMFLKGIQEMDRYAVVMQAAANIAETLPCYQQSDTN